MLEYMYFKCDYTTGYEVIKERDKFYAIYLNDVGKKFITHRESFKQATKVAKLLSEAYKEGVLSCY